MRKRIVLFFPFLWTAAVVLCACGGTWSTDETFVMNTVLQQMVNGPEEVCVQNARVARGLENLLSRTVPGSDIYEVNLGSGPVEVADATREVVEAALAAWETTGGAFDPALGSFRDAWGFGDDPHVPSEEQLAQLLAAPGAQAIILSGSMLDAGGADIDLGGAAKGYALDEMNASMAEQKIQNALISFGGAILARGHRQNGGLWRIGIRDPFSEDASAYVGTFEVSDAMVETSGVSEQSFTADGTLYHHILDPETGMPVRNSLMSVCVVSDSGMMADIWSTTLFVMGLEEGSAFAEEHDIAALFITDTRQMKTTSAFRYPIEDIDPAYTLI